jgi:lactate dehydrogenase-like 2-hydroxyacid dehydrogenase
VRPIVVVVGAVPEVVLDRLHRETEVHVVSDGEQLRRSARDGALRGVEGLLVTGQAAVDQEVLAAAPALRVISLRAVGHDRVDLEECSRRGIRVCTTPGVLEAAVADLTLLLMLGLARRFREALAPLDQPSATPPPLGVDLRGCTLGIVGMGRIGLEVARSAHAAFDMAVLYTARSRRTVELGRQVTLDELLSESDVVSLHVPLSPETAGLIGARELSLMKPSAFLIDTARAGLVDFRALEAALTSQDIAGAALDVPLTDYPAADSPSRRLPQLLLTPHIGSATHGTRTAMAEMAAENLVLVLQGRTALSCVNEEHVAAVEV